MGLQVPRCVRATLCSCPSDDGKSSSAKRVANWVRSSTRWLGKRSVRSLRGALCRTMCTCVSRFPPKHPVASVIGFLKGKSAIAIARLSGKERNFSGEHFWARGYAVSTVGFELEQVRTYIREQDAADGAGGQF
jgi:putative transposase